MVRTELGIEMLVMEVHPANVLAPIDVTEDGIMTLVTAVLHSLHASHEQTVMAVEPGGMVNVVIQGTRARSLTHFERQYRPGVLILMKQTLLQLDYFEIWLVRRLAPAVTTTPA